MSRLKPGLKLKKGLKLKEKFRSGPAKLRKRKRPADKTFIVKKGTTNRKV